MCPNLRWSALFGDNAKIKSDFVAKTQPDTKRSKIGHYYCNEIYKIALQWGHENNNRPVAFMHVPVLSGTIHSVERATALLRAMRSYPSTTLVPETP